MVEDDGLHCVLLLDLHGVSEFDLLQVGPELCVSLGKGQALHAVPDVVVGIICLDGLGCGLLEADPAGDGRALALLLRLSLAGLRVRVLHRLLLLVLRQPYRPL